MAQNFDLTRLDTAKPYVALLTYTCRAEKLRPLSAPFVRLFTGRIYNHSALLIFECGQWWLYESAEKGVVRTKAPDCFGRRGTRWEFRSYSGPVSAMTVRINAHQLLGTKYDYVGLLFEQLVYRVSLNITAPINHIFGRKILGGLWLGKKGAAARARMQCFEFVFNCFNMAGAAWASGFEFEYDPHFKTKISLN